MENYHLNDGQVLPQVGFGTYKLNGSSGVHAIVNALNNGYRILDTAYNYENEGNRYSVHNAEPTFLREEQRPASPPASDNTGIPSSVFSFFRS